MRDAGPADEVRGEQQRRPLPPAVGRAASRAAPTPWTISEHDQHRLLAGRGARPGRRRAAEALDAARARRARRCRRGCADRLKAEWRSRGSSGWPRPEGARTASGRWIGGPHGSAPRAGGRQQRAARALALQLEVAERRPAGKRGVDAVVAQRRGERLLDARALGAARAARSRWRPGRRARAAGAGAAARRRRRGWPSAPPPGERSPPVLTSTATSARVGSIAIEPRPSGTSGRRAPRPPPRCRRRRARSAPRAGCRRRVRQSRSASAAAPGARRGRPRRAVGAAGERCHSGAQRRDLGRDRRVGGVGGRRAQDQAEVRRRRRPSRSSPSAASAARRSRSRRLRARLRPGRVRGQDRRAALEQHARAHRRRLAGLGPAR